MLPGNAVVSLVVPAVLQRDPRYIVDADAHVGLTDPVRFALDSARTPIRVAELAEKVLDAYPTTSPRKVTGLLTGLVQHWALLSGLVARARALIRSGI